MKINHGSEKNDYLSLVICYFSPSTRRHNFIWILKIVEVFAFIRHMSL